MKRGLKGIAIIVLGILVLSSIVGGYVLFSEGSPFASKYSLIMTVKDAYGAVEGATVDVAGNTYTTDSTGSITPLMLAKGTYAIIVTAQEHGTKTQLIDLVSDMDLIIELDYTHQYLTISSPVNGALISSDVAENDPSGLANIVIWVQGRYTPGRETGNYIKTFIDDDSRYALTSVSTIWNAKVYVGQVSAGSHTLYVQFLSGNNVIEQQSIEVIIPTEWHVYFSTVGLADTGDGISRNPSDYPYWLGMNPPFPGQVTRIVGEYYLDILDNEPCEVWVDLWNPNTNKWVIAEKILDTRSGWNTFDVGVDYVTTTWWGLAGCYYHDDPAKTAYNRVTEFKGEVWMVAGTHHYHTSSTNILDWLNDQFFPAGEEKSTFGPAPVLSSDGITILDIDPSDLYVYAGSTPIAWIICITISLIVILGVVIYLVKKRR